MESKRERRYFPRLEDNGAHAWTPYDAYIVRCAITRGTSEGFGVRALARLFEERRTKVRTPNPLTSPFPNYSSPFPPP